MQSVYDTILYIFIYIYVFLESHNHTPSKSMFSLGTGLYGYFPLDNGFNHIFCMFSLSLFLLFCPTSISPFLFLVGWLLINSFNFQRLILKQPITGMFCFFSPNPRLAVDNLLASLLDVLHFAAYLFLLLYSCSASVPLTPPPQLASPHPYNSPILYERSLTDP